MMTGGAGAEQNVTAEEKSIVEKVWPEVLKQRQKEYVSYEPKTFKAQVVAGMNYFVKVMAKTASGEECFVLKIYKPLPHMGSDLQLSGIKESSASDAIEHF
ncbi:hypothetical protein GUITHDRAFT_156393 [Guillardia theta CCMP2712]|uniref:Cystatin domain-containing protein n=2 Tax=Guillardia theta TaxID=55529 RepID=L1I8J8_GUITC|nr:hypothetical protein GUITHDRAFT_156393 [Guillardia theta CCMP2712]EKX32219.1 hypothetical protein GUITHDRAFT_156393 [Guillardia theta CCMP2712]|eukprot:XP_005819199.1 hypothetical protein GUITHDRAFT_156393 [Guillardia theta CCMP2712]